LKTKIALEEINSGTIPIIKELSRAFPQSFDAERTSLNERSEINTIPAMVQNSGRLGAVSIVKVLEEIAFDETALGKMLVNLLIPPTNLSPFYRNNKYNGIKNCSITLKYLKIMRVFMIHI